MAFKCGTWRLKQDNRSLESEPHDELSETAFVTRGGLPGPEKRFEQTCDWICSQIRRNRRIFPKHWTTTHFYCYLPKVLISKSMSNEMFIYRIAGWRLLQTGYLLYLLAYKLHLNQPVEMSCKKFSDIVLFFKIQFDYTRNGKSGKTFSYLKPNVTLKHSRTSATSLVFNSEWHWWYHAMW